jgi:hypothetical protein
MKLNKNVFGKILIAVLFVLLIVWFLRRTSREGGANRKVVDSPTPKKIKPHTANII